MVVEDSVRLASVCDFAGFLYETERDLARLVVADAPPQGQSTAIHISDIRAAIAEAFELIAPPEGIWMTRFTPN